MTPDQLYRREVLAGLLDNARICPVYARKAAQLREQIGRDHGVNLFAGMVERFDLEWAKLKGTAK